MIRGNCHHEVSGLKMQFGLHLTYMYVCLVHIMKSTLQEYLKGAPRQRPGATATMKYQA